MSSLASNYDSHGFFDELIGPDRQPRAAARALFEHLDALDMVGLTKRAKHRAPLPHISPVLPSLL